MPNQNPIPSFGSRGGRALRPRQKALTQDLLPKLEITPDEAGAGHLTQDGRALWLEIGFGAGDHLIHMASTHPDQLWVGAEVFREGIASCLNRITQGYDTPEQANIRLLPGDARLLIEALPDASLTGAHILFPDPWPKARHHKRRIINQETLALLSRVIKPGGELFLATDHDDYRQWMLVQMTNQPFFMWTASSMRDWQTPPADYRPTRYHIKTEKQGRKPIFLRYTRT